MKTSNKKPSKTDFVESVLGARIVRKKGRDKGKPIAANEVYIFSPKKNGLLSEVKRREKE